MVRPKSLRSLLLRIVAAPALAVLGVLPTTVSANSGGALGAGTVVARLTWGTGTAPSLSPTFCASNLAGHISADYVVSFTNATVRYTGPIHLEADMAEINDPNFCTNFTEMIFALDNVTLSGSTPAGTISCAVPPSPGPTSNPNEFWTSGQTVLALYADCDIDGSPLPLGFSVFPTGPPPVPTHVDASGDATRAVLAAHVLVTGA